jgi:hypothetical protein
VKTGDDGMIWVTSTRNPDGKPVCQITWGDQSWYAPVADIRTAALDLVTCAAYAEMMITLITKVGLPARTVSAFTSDLLSGAGRTMFGTRSTLELLPAGSSKRKEAVVLIRRDPDGGWPGGVSPAEARQMALAWLEAAEATESDQLVAEALRATGTADDEAMARVFGYLRELRA